VKYTFAVRVPVSASVVLKGNEILRALLDSNGVVPGAGVAQEREKGFVQFNSFLRSTKNPAIQRDRQKRRTSLLSASPCQLHSGMKYFQALLDSSSLAPGAGGAQESGEWKIWPSSVKDKALNPAIQRDRCPSLKKV